MKLFVRSGGCWLFWMSVIYLIIGFVNISVYEFTEPEFIQIGFILILSLPLVYKRLARHLNMSTIWEMR
jgi:hypothetical protein